MTNSTTGEKIKQLRLDLNMTQKELGEKCGMYESQIRKYESGKANPKFATLQKIAAALNVSVFELMSGPTFQLTKDMIDLFAGSSSLELESVSEDTITPYVRELGEFLYYNPEHKALFDSSMQVRKEDICFVKEMIDRINNSK